MWVRNFDAVDGVILTRQLGAMPGPPQLVLLFGATETLRVSPVPAMLAALYPDAVQLGCSTGTVVDRGALDEEGLRLVAIGFADTRVALCVRPLADVASSFQVGVELGTQMDGEDLAGLFILSDGLKVNGSALVSGLQSVLGHRAAISGGLAGDGARFDQTLLTVGGQPVSGVVAAVAFYGSAIRIAHGSAGGWNEFGPVRSVTRSEGSVLHELDGRPALDLYEAYLGEEAADLPASALIYPLKIWNQHNPSDAYVRTVLSIDREARTMTFAGDIPEGWRASLMRGSFDHLVNGASEAAEHAVARMREFDAEPQLCLFVSCVGRRLLLGQRTEDEVEAVGQVLGEQTPIIGYYSYGEIAPHNRSRVCGLHNQTVTLTLLAEAA